MSALAPRPSQLRSAAILLALLGLTGCAGTAASGSPATSSNPAASGGADRTIAITMTDSGCSPVPATISAGPVTFQIVNQESNKTSEAELVRDDVILGEKEHLTPGLSGSFSLELTAGAYEVFCPGATTERTPFTVTEAASPS